MFIAVVVVALLMVRCHSPICTEIYNEKIFDLLSGPDVSRIKTRPDLRINEDENGRVNIMGLSMVQMKTLKVISIHAPMPLSS